MPPKNYIPLNTQNINPDQITGTSILHAQSNRFLHPIKRINFFVGPNNSGKSLLIREIIRQGINILPAQMQAEDSISILMLKGVIEAIEKVENILLGNGVSSIEFSSRSEFLIHPEITVRTLSCKTEEIGIKIFNINKLNHNNLAEIIDTSSRIESFVRHLYQQTDMMITFEESRHQDNLNRIKKQLKNIIDDSILELNLNSATYLWGSIPTEMILYVPSLRTLRNFGEANQSNHFISSITARNSQEFDIPQHNIIDGGNFFNHVYNLLNSSSQARSQLKSYEEFLSEWFFEGKSVSLVSNTSEGKSHQRFQIRMSINGEERFLEEMGDGIQQIILLTYPLFFFDQGILAIEEPEINLEPAFQRKLISLYLNHPRSQNFTFFITTHSTTVLDSTLINQQAVSIFRVKKTLNTLSGLTQLTDKTKQLTKISPKEFSHLTPTPIFSVDSVPELNRDILSDIGAKPSSMLLANGIIWVEGPSDVIYIKTWLDILQIQKYQQLLYSHGVHYEFQMYGGSLLKYIYHPDSEQADDQNALVNILKINPNSYLVMDSDFFEHGRLDSMESIKLQMIEALGEENTWYDKQIPTIEMYIPKNEKYWKMEPASLPFWDPNNENIVRKGVSKSTLSQNVTSRWVELTANNEFDWKDFPDSLNTEINKLLKAISTWNS